MVCFGFFPVGFRCFLCEKPFYVTRQDSVQKSERNRFLFCCFVWNFFDSIRYRISLVLLFHYHFRSNIVLLLGLIIIIVIIVVSVVSQHSVSSLLYILAVCPI